MTQKHFEQQGTFHVTTNTKNDPWCLGQGIPEILIDNLVMTRNLCRAELHAFCILPDHVHIVLSPGPKGLSQLMHSFKRNAMWDIRKIHPSSGRSRSSATVFPEWQKSFFDERIRDDRQRSNALSYVQYNAYHHGLTDDPCGWPWSSLAFPDVLDPLDVWFD